MFAARKFWSTAALLLGGVHLAACAGPADEVGGKAQALGGFEGTFEYAIDAPWRIEPSPQGYGAIPIQISVHDVMFDAMDRAHDTTVNGAQTLEQIDADFGLQRFSRVEVAELLPGGGTATRHYDFEDLAEVEATHGCWAPDHLTLGARATARVNCSSSSPERLVCRDPSTCLDWFRGLEGTSEWHAQLWYTPQPGSTFPGNVIPLEVRLYVDGTDIEGAPREFVLTNYLRVRLGDAPLPTFGDNWLYGDLHYHAAGSDNEGESAYNYRGVARAMGALGLDFSFISDHASDSEQIVDTDIDLQVWDEEHHDVDAVVGGVARDLTRKRFEYLHAVLHQSPESVNAEAVLQGAGGGLPQTTRSRGVVPQLFLGEELDAMPEIDSEARTYTYGDGVTYDVGTLCEGWHGTWPIGSCEQTCENDPDPRCEERSLFWPQADGAYVLRDVQGFNELWPGREHLIYLPRTADLTIGGQSAFISSRTGLYGGAGRRLEHSVVQYPPLEVVPPLLPEIAAKGYAFVAHPMNDSASEGPNGPPWGDFMLRKAWRSPGVAGLQLWNEGVRLHKDIDTGDDETGYQRPDDLWHKTPSDYVRSGFATGEFELRPWDPRAPVWDWGTIEDVALERGLAALDRMNLWGLDPTQTAALGWLPAGEPRRVLLAAGSDAHGDLNYHRTGYFLGTTEVTDSAMGKPRNLVYAGDPAQTTAAGRVYSHEQVVEALAAGHFSMTDGPALRMVVDRNGDGAFDDPEEGAGLVDRWGVPLRGDVPMGGVVHFYSPTETIPVLIEWASTPEFGRVNRLEYVLGRRCSDGTTELATIPVDIGSPAMTGTATVDIRPLPCGEGNDVLHTTGVPVTGMFVRASVYTERDASDLDCRHSNTDAARTGHCIERRAHTNPIWFMGQDDPVACPFDNGAMDTNGNLVPDGCETDDIVGIAYYPPWQQYFAWRWDGTVHRGSATDLDSAGTYSHPLHVPAGKHLADVVGMGYCGKIAGLSTRLFTWYRDGTVSQGWATDLEALVSPRTFSTPLPASEIVSITCNEVGDGKVYARYRDGTYSVGTPSALDLYQSRQFTSLPAGKQPGDLVAQVYGGGLTPYLYFRGGSTSGPVQLTSKFLGQYTYPYLGTQQGELGLPGL